MAYDRHACLMADKCEPVTANASSAGLTGRAAYSPKTRPDTGPSYITALGLGKKKLTLAQFKKKKKRERNFVFFAPRNILIWAGGDACSSQPLTYSRSGGCGEQTAKNMRRLVNDDKLSRHWLFVGQPRSPTAQK